MTTLTNPFALVLIGYIQDIESGIAYLGRDLSDEQYYAAARAMCELSRDISFSLGQPAEYNRDYIDRIIKLLTRAAAAINPKDNAALEAFKMHILGRVKLLEESHVSQTTEDDSAHNLPHG
jgi:hypothetical protein